jgi:hypothetical protein
MQASFLDASVARLHAIAGPHPNVIELSPGWDGRASNAL